MNSDIMQAEAASATGPTGVHTKKQWRPPTLILENAKYATLGKAPDPTEMSVVLNQGPMS